MSKFDVPLVERVYRKSDDLTASLKRFPEDFVVDELWQPEFSGDGEHLYLQVEKVGQNTAWVAQQLAKVFGAVKKDVGYSGLKDRQAITRQWFSLTVPAERAQIEPQIEGVKILQRGRHSHKLRRGTHAGNRFAICLRDLEGDLESHQGLLAERLDAVAEHGFPNYFGSQRFGRGGNNLRTGMQLSARRQLIKHPKRGIYLSAMRSALFNGVLAEQIRLGNWPEILASAYPATGPMWGRGRPIAAEIGADVEARIVGEQSELCDILEHGGLSQERRPLVQKCTDFNYSIEGADLLLSFDLPPGSYATVLIEELVAIRHERDHLSPNIQG